MAKRWYYTTGGKRYGPITTTELKELANTGRLSTDDLVRREDTAKWRKAGSVEGLFPASSAQPPDLPPRPASTSEFPAKTGSNTALIIMGIAAAGVFIQMVICCGVLDLIGEEGGGGQRPEALSEEFYPHREGATQQRIARGGIGLPIEMQMRREYVHDGNGTITCRTLNNFLTKAQMNVPITSTKFYRYRIRDGFIEIGSGEYVTHWTRIIKIGAVVGDTWEATHYDITDRFEVLRFEDYTTPYEAVAPDGSVWSVVIEQRTTMPSLKEGTTLFITEHTLGYGIGPVEKVTWEVKDGEKILVSDEAMVSPLRE